MRLLRTLLVLIALASAGAWVFLAVYPHLNAGPAAAAPQDSSAATQSAPLSDPATASQSAGEPQLEAARTAPAADETTTVRTADAGGEEPTFRIEEAFEAPPPAAAEASPPAPPPSLIEGFKSRAVAYNRPPSVMQLGRAIDVSLVIDATAAPDAAAPLDGFPGTVVEREVELSDVVSAQLTGVGFEITAQSVERQKLSDRTQNRWQWRVTPTETGRRTLILEIFGYAQGSLDAEPLDAYRDDIMVEVRDLDRLITLATNVQPVFAIIAAIAGALSVLVGFLRLRVEKRRG